MTFDRHNPLRLLLEHRRVFVERGFGDRIDVAAIER